jgi:hypothetical protein
VRKRHFLRHLYIKCIILPRQARDKHRENSKKVPFSLRNYALFKALAAEMFLCLRRHAPVLYTTLRCVLPPEQHKHLREHLELRSAYQSTGATAATTAAAGSAVDGVDEGAAAAQVGTAPKFADDGQARTMFIDTLDRAQSTSNFMMLDMAHGMAKARDAGTQGIVTALSGFIGGTQ